MNGDRLTASTSLTEFDGETFRNSYVNETIGSYEIIAACNRDKQLSAKHSITPSAKAVLEKMATLELNKL